MLRFDEHEGGCESVTEVRIAAASSQDDRAGSFTVERLRTIVEDSHLNFLIGAGTPSAYFGLLGDVEVVLTELDHVDIDPTTRALARASVRAYFFDRVIEPSLGLLTPDASASAVLRSYAIFAQVLNRVVLRRRSSLLNKQVNIFTTNVDLVFEVAFERLGIEFNDGFSGKIRPTFDLGSFGSLRYRSGVRYEHRSEVPTFDLYKLHGSVGWMLLDDPAITSEITFDHALSNVVRVRKSLSALREHLVAVTSPSQLDADALIQQCAGRSFPDGYTAFDDAYEQLVIINPEKEKFATTVLTETYYELIRRFANELERENSALFVHGFSFRDEHLRKLVVRAARANPTLQVIVFCYQVADRAAYEALIPALDVPNGNITYITPPADPDGGEGVALDLDAMVERYLSPLIPEAQRRPDTQIELIFKSDPGVGS